MNTRYFQAQFASSASRLAECPAAAREVAFAGRSNAGKSSAINTLTRNGKLARTGKTPGRTQLINHFSLGDELFLVDLPGYGYAEVSKQKQKAWQSAMTSYLQRRDPLVGLVLVMDIRHPLTDSDWQLLQLQQAGTAELHLLLTKADKLSRQQVIQALRDTQQKLEAAGIEASLSDFSALKRQGIDDVHQILDSWLFDTPVEFES